MDEDKVSVVSKGVKAENTRKVGTKRTEELGAKNTERMERKIREENIADLAPTSSGAADPEARLEVGMLESAMKNYSSI